MATAQGQLTYLLFKLLLDPGSGIEKKSGSGIKILNPQHWLCEVLMENTSIEVESNEKEGVQ
jgi:hypothetical protein